MKKVILVAMFALIGSIALAGTKGSTRVGTNPIGLLGGVTNFSGEYFLEKEISVGGHYIGWGDSYSTTTAFGVFGRYYMANKTGYGKWGDDNEFFAGASFNSVSTNWNIFGISGSASGTAIVPNFGWQWRFDEISHEAVWAIPLIGSVENTNLGAAFSMGYTIGYSF